MNDSPSTAVRTWLKGFRPLTLNARPRDCLRAGLGACIGALAAVFACQALFGSELALRLAAPLGASAVLLFALASSPLAQPWSMLGGNLVAALAGGLSAYWFGHDLAPALVGMALGMLLMFALRCLHPPSCALALSVALNPSLSELGIDVVWPILLSTLVLIGCALLYNNLMRSPYPRPYQSPRANLHGTRDLAPSARTDFSARDLDGLGGPRADGKALAAGDSLGWLADGARPRALPLPSERIMDCTGEARLELILGAQIGDFPAMSLFDAFNGDWQVDTRADRMGVRLLGPRLECRQQSMISEGIALGAVQVPPDGQPIVLLNDRQTIGGYPRLGALAPLALARLAQCLPGQRVRLLPTVQEAAHREHRRVLAAWDA